MKQEAPANVTATTWSAKIQSTKAVDLGYFADGAIQTISRTQGADVYESLPLLTTYDAIANGLKHEGKLGSITHSGFTTNGLSPGDRVYSYEYDDQGRIEYMKTPAGQRKYGYDSFDQQPQVSIGESSSRHQFSSIRPLPASSHKSAQFSHWQVPPHRIGRSIATQSQWRAIRAVQAAPKRISKGVLATTEYPSVNHT